MTIPAGRTGIEIGANQYVCPVGYPFKIVNRYSQGGIPRTKKTAINGTVITQAINPAQLDRLLVLRVEALRENELDTWKTMFDTMGVASLKLHKDVATQIAVDLTGVFEDVPYDGPWPEGAPLGVTWSTLEFEVVRLE